MSEKKVLIHLDNVKMHFPLKKTLAFWQKQKHVKAVDGVSFDIYENETFGLVGESGCGKSTLGKLILQLHSQTTGNINYNNKCLNALPKEEMRKMRKELQIVFQDRYSSLTPRFTVIKLISEAVVAHKLYKKGSKQLEDYTLDIMEKCGLQKHMLHRYPHQFSGGQRQRIGIARALALEPKFVVCDECVSTLDVSIQSQIINLLLELKEKNNLTYLFISHDLSVVRFLSDRIGVMYLGNIVELTDTETVLNNALHPYTQALLDAIPSIEQTSETQKQSTLLEGETPSPIDPPSGCKFHPRCKYKTEKCTQEAPMLAEISKGHFVACHLASKGGAI